MFLEGWDHRYSSSSFVHPQSEGDGRVGLAISACPQMWPAWYAAHLTCWTNAALVGGMFSGWRLPCENRCLCASLTLLRGDVWLYKMTTNLSNSCMSRSDIGLNYIWTNVIRGWINGILVVLSGSIEFIVWHLEHFLSNNVSCLHNNSGISVRVSLTNKEQCIINILLELEYHFISSLVSLKARNMCKKILFKSSWVGFVDVSLPSCSRWSL